jgi:hypothetical protein
MRIYVVAPGATFSTSDVYDGLCAGLRANGIDVYEGQLDTILRWYELAFGAGIKTGVFETSDLVNIQKLASAHITQHILQVWPDLVIVVSGHNYHVDDVRTLKRVGLPVVCLMTESPYFLDIEMQFAAIYDAVTTNEARCVDMLRLANSRASYLPHAWHPERHTPDGPKADACDAFFVGSWFGERKALLEGVDWTGLRMVWKGHDLTPTPGNVLPNAEAAAYYRSAGVSLNIHRTTTSHGTGRHIRPEDVYSLNPRAYEIPACGGLMLCDNSRGEGTALFGDAFVTYKAGDSDDLSRQLRWWLAHPRERDECATEQHARILPHSWTARAAQMLEAIL